MLAVRHPVDSERVVRESCAGVADDFERVVRARAERAGSEEERLFLAAQVAAAAGIAAAIRGRERG